MSGPLHRDLAAGRWHELTLAEQLGNIGSEVSRASKWRGRNEQLATGALERALELLDLTLADPRLRGSVARLREIARAREVVVDFLAGSTPPATGALLGFVTALVSHSQDNIVYGDRTGIGYSYAFHKVQSFANHQGDPVLILLDANRDGGLDSVLQLSNAAYVAQGWSIMENFERWWLE